MHGFQPRITSFRGWLNPDCWNDVSQVIPEVFNPGVIPEVFNPGSRRGVC